MSLLVTTDIECDGCRDWTHGDTGYSVHAREARREAKASGWYRVSVDGRMVDLCPKCAVKLAEPVEEAS